MIFLSTRDVSSPVIIAMKNAMKKKSTTIISPNGYEPDNNTITKNQDTQSNITSNTENTFVKNFYIIAGSYPIEQQANDAVADLKLKGFSNAEIVGKNDSGGYRIAYKGYVTYEEAANDLPQIKQTINPSAWIFEKK
jgi:cell division protein FtsN